MDNFKEFSLAVQNKLAELKHRNILLYTAHVDTAVAQHTYLNNFPVTADEERTKKACNEAFTRDTRMLASPRALYIRESNPLHSVRAENDCTCCNRFIGNCGVILYYVGETLHSIWDHLDVPAEYAEPIAALSTLAKNAGISQVLSVHNAIVGSGITRTSENAYNHYHGKVDIAYTHKSVDSPHVAINDRMTGLMNVAKDIKREAVDTVIELISENKLTKSIQYADAVNKVKEIMNEYASSQLDGRDFAYAYFSKAFAENKINGISRLKFSSPIHVLLTNLSAGDDLQVAIEKYEAMVNASSYNTSTAAPTEVQAVRAIDVIDKLGLRASLPRRHASVADISPADVLYVDRTVKTGMSDPLLDMFIGSTAVGKRKNVQTGDSISVSELIEMVPDITKLEAYVGKDLLNNAVTLIAPVNADAPSLTKWGNPYTLTYTGDVTDAITKRVRKAGGAAPEVFGISYMWHNTDDYDISVLMPDGTLVSWENTDYRSKRILDVDRNADNAAATVKPVENLNLDHIIADGEYVFRVHNFDKRNVGSGFNAKSECMIVHDGVKTTYQLHDQLDNRELLVICTVSVKDGKQVNLEVNKQFKPYVNGDEYNIAVGEYLPVSMIMNSPNHWDTGNKKGPKHHVFMLEGMTFTGKPKGFFTEYLLPELHTERKALTVLADKMRCEESSDQLTGLGFSDNVREQDKKQLSVRVTTDSGKRAYTVTF